MHGQQNIKNFKTFSQPDKHWCGPHLLLQAGGYSISQRIFILVLGGWLLFASNWSIEPLDKCNVSGE